jgi:hypothetical protein
MSRARGQTRATCAPAREDAVTVEGVRIPPAQGRTPFAVVDLQIDGVPMSFAFRGLRRDRWEVCPPTAADGRPGFIADEELHDLVAALVLDAVQRDEAAIKHVRGWRKRRQREI